jgi:hypothetical protein
MLLPLYMLYLPAISKSYFISYYVEFRLEIMLHLRFSYTAAFAYIMHYHDVKI